MKITTANIPYAILIPAVLLLAPGCLAASRQSHKTHRVDMHGPRASHPTAVGSFLGAMVYTAPDLIYQLETHPAIAARYARHYHMTPANIIRYMKTNLVESYMPRTQVFKTYWVRRNGQIRTGQERLVKGTRVFALRNGQPVLKWVCGNPLTTSLPPVRTMAASTDMSFHSKMAPSEEMMVPSEPADVIIPTEAPPVMMTEVPDEPIRFSSAALPPAASSFSFPWLPIAALPIIVGVTHSGGGGGSKPPPAPESSTLISFAAIAGLGAFMAMRRRRPDCC